MKVIKVNKNFHKREVTKAMRGITVTSKNWLILSICLLLVSLLFAHEALAANSTTAGIVSAWSSGTTSIKVKMPYTGDDNANNTYTVRWKLCTDGSYPPGNVINGSHTGSPFIAEITGLTANTCYNIQATYNDTDGVTGSNPQEIKIYSTWDSTLLHNINRFPSSTKWSPNGWGVPGGQYGQFDCGVCHEPRATNIKGIKSTVVAPSGNFPGSTVVFQSVTSPDGFGDDTGGHTTSTKICEVCHSITNYHRYNTSGQSNLTHNNNTDCTQCHPHSIGFAPAGGACDSCHGNPPITATLGGPTGLATPATGATSPLSPGAHQVHVSSRGMTCDVCHRGTAMPASEKLIDMGFSVSSTSYPAWAGPAVESGTFTGYNALLNGYAWRASWTGTSVNTAPNYDNRCSSIYCHGSTLTGGTNTSPSWVGGSAEAGCGTCHGASASTPPTTGNHIRHASNSAGNLNLACTKCHSAVTDGSHVNGSVAWDLDDTDSRIGASATYRGSNAGQTGQLAPSATYGQCSNIYCHSNVQTSPPGGALTYGTPTWGGGTLTCSTASCHGGDTDPNKIATGSHTKHVQTSGYNYSCSVCHLNRGKDTAYHADYNIDVNISFGGQGGTYSGNPAPGDAYGSCSSVYCHGATTPAWGGAALDCGGCHYGNNTLAGKHSVHYATTTLATSTSFTPSNNSTTTAYIYSCGVCHNATSHAQGPVSANQAAQVSFDATVAGGGTYTAGAFVAADRGFNWTAGTCSSTYCHSNGAGGAPNNTTFNWNSPTGTLGCNGCHNYTKASGTPMATGSHTAHINNADAALATFNCYRCHNATTTNDTSIANKSLHVNRTKNVNFDTLNPSGTYTSPNCSNLYCHSTGKTSTDVPPANLPAIYGGSHFTTMAWGGAAIGCNGCHGRSVSAGAPDYTSTGAGAAGANSHMAHTGNGTDSGSCDTCHTNTTNTGTSIKAGSTLHLNTTREVTFNTTKAGSGATYTAGTKTCSNLACHGTSQWGGPSQTCVSCHSAALGDRRQITGSGGDFVRSSRHVSNGTTTEIVTQWDCVVCHLEGDETYTTGRARIRAVSSPTAVGHTGIPGSKADVNLRNVDLYTTGWIWNRFDVLTGNGPRGTLTQADKSKMRNDMDRFCLTCHDSDTSANPPTLHDIGTSFTGLLLQKVANAGGAASIKATSTGLRVGTVAVGTFRMRPFNELDTGMNVHETSTTVRTERSNRFNTSNLGPIDVRGQFNYTGAVGSAWASHHNLNIFQKRYTTRSTAIFPTTLWTTYVTKEGSAINGTGTGSGETAGLHCSDCHLNEVNAHGTTARYMLANGFTDVDAAWSGVASTVDPGNPCYRCHRPYVYNQASTGIGRFDHARDSNRTLTTITSPFGIICFNCHGGFSANPYNRSFGAIHGTNESYTPGVTVITTTAGQTKRYRFMSGSVMRAYKPGVGTGTFVEPTSWTDTSSDVGCYTVGANDTWSSGCTSHGSGVAGGGGLLNYPKPLQW